MLKTNRETCEPRERLANGGPQGEEDLVGYARIKSKVIPTSIS